MEEPESPLDQPATAVRPGVPSNERAGSGLEAVGATTGGSGEPVTTVVEEKQAVAGVGEAMADDGESNHGVDVVWVMFLRNVMFVHCACAVVHVRLAQFRMLTGVLKPRGDYATGSGLSDLQLE